jgi:hypothetical protein
MLLAVLIFRSGLRKSECKRAGEVHVVTRPAVPNLSGLGNDFTV